MVVVADNVVVDVNRKLGPMLVAQAYHYLMVWMMILAAPMDLHR